MHLTKKVQSISEKEYRGLKNEINASAVKLYIQNKSRFVKEVVMGEPVERKDTADTIMGSMIHCRILEPETFEDKYVISQMLPPTGQMLELVNTLYAEDIKTRDSEGRQQVQFEGIFLEAVNKVKYDHNLQEIAFKGKSVEKIIEMFTTADKKTGIAPEQYYKELLQNRDKTVVTMLQIEKCEKIVEEMKQNKWIDRWVNARDTEDQHVYNEHAIQFSYKDMKTRALIDRFIVNHEDKYIEPVDIKSVWDAEGVAYTYISRYWYIQAAMYDMALRHFAVENGLDGYTILPLRWLITDTTGFNKSHTYRTTERDLKKAYEGFHTRSGRYYPGLLPTLEEIIWASDNGIWSYNKQLVDANGEYLLEIPYE